MEAHAATEAMLLFQAEAENFSCFPHALLAVYNTFLKKRKNTPPNLNNDTFNRILIYLFMEE